MADTDHDGFLDPHNKDQMLRFHFAEAIASVRREGLVVDDNATAVFARVLAGELTIHEALALIQA